MVVTIRGMTRRGFGGTLVACAAAALLGGCGDDRFPDYHYKMTVYAQGKAFSSVRAVTQTEESSIQSSGTILNSTATGEAVILDLPDGRTVYALMSSPGREGYAANVAEVALLPKIRQHERDPRFDDLSSDRNKAMDDNARDAQAMMAVTGAHDLPRELKVNSLGRSIDPPVSTWPMFVTFDDPADPKTVRALTPEEVGVTRITMEITEEPVATGIEKRLANGFWEQWAIATRTARHDRSSFASPTTRALFENLSRSDFVAEKNE